MTYLIRDPILTDKNPEKNKFFSLDSQDFEGPALKLPPKKLILIA